MIQASESQIQRSILDWCLLQRGIIAHRINVVGTPLHKDGFTFFRRSPNVGMADLHLTVSVSDIPVSVWFEVKSGKGRQSKNQKAFENRILAFGGWYFIVRSIDDCIKAVEEIRAHTIATLEDYNDNS